MLSCCGGREVSLSYDIFVLEILSLEKFRGKHKFKKKKKTNKKTKNRRPTTNLNWKPIQWNTFAQFGW